MTETKTVQLTAEIRELAQKMERRCRQSAKKITAGTWKHYNFMSEADLIEGAQRNLDHLTNELTPEKALSVLKTFK